MLWKETQKLIQKVEASILTGGFLVFDPSSGSGSSFPGWAYYEGGQLKASGILKVPVHAELHLKLGMIRDMVQQLCEKYVPDIAVIEQIESMRGFRGKSVDILMKSVGAIMAGIPCDVLLQIAPRTWKKSVDENYVKSDEADAIYIGRFVVLACIELKESREGILWKPARKAPSTRKPRAKQPKTKVPRASSNSSPKSSLRVRPRSRRS